MASYSGFIRRSPRAGLAKFFKHHRVDIPADSNWDSNGWSKVFVKELNTLIDELPGIKQDRVKAELDHLASLATPKGMQAAEQLCPALCIDLEGIEGVEDVLLMLAVDHPQILERVSVQAALLSRYGGRSWSAFQLEDDGKPWALGDEGARADFVSDAIAILELPDHRKRDADWYTTIRTDPITGEETEIVQATIYVEGRAESGLTFGQSSELERSVIQRVLEVGIACNPADRIVEICSNGGKKTRDQYAQAFSKHFAPDSEPPVEAPRRQVLLDGLKSRPDFQIEPADGIERIDVTSLDFFASGGGFSRLEYKGENESIYHFLGRRFGDKSPLTAPGWILNGATLRIVLAPSDGKRRKTLIITLRTPNVTTIPNKTETDRQFILDLLERWKLVAPPILDFDVIEAA